MIDLSMSQLYAKAFDGNNTSIIRIKMSVPRLWMLPPSVKKIVCTLLHPEHSMHPKSRVHRT